MPEYLCRPTYLLRPDAAEIVETKGCLKSCGHAPGYRCCCRAHQDSEQDCQDCYDEMTMAVGYKLARHERLQSLLAGARG